MPKSKQQNKSSNVEGTFVVLGRGGGIVRCLEYPAGIRIYDENVNAALHGDEIKAEVIGHRKDEVVGKITEVVLRAKTEFTGVLVQRDGKYFLKASDPKMYASIEISNAGRGEASPRRPRLCSHGSMDQSKTKTYRTSHPHARRPWRTRD